MRARKVRSNPIAAATANDATKRECESYIVPAEEQGKVLRYAGTVGSSVGAAAGMAVLGSGSGGHARRIIRWVDGHPQRGGRSPAVIGCHPRSHRMSSP